MRRIEWGLIVIATLAAGWLAFQIWLAFDHGLTSVAFINP